MAGVLVRACEPLAGQGPGGARRRGLVLRDAPADVDLRPQASAAWLTWVFARW